MQASPLAFPRFSAQNVIRFGAQKSPKPSGPPTQEEINEKLEKLAPHLTLGYYNEVQGVIKEIKDHINNYLKTHDPKKTAVGFDLDETVWSGLASDLMKLVKPTPYQYTYKGWQKTAQAPPIPGMVELIHWLVDDKKVNVFFITARLEEIRKDTEKNLANIGLPSKYYQGIYMKDKFVPPSQRAKNETNTFKVNAQKDIEAKGYKVAAMVGDQAADVDNCLGKGFKLPNHIYQTI